MEEVKDKLTKVAKETAKYLLMQQRMAEHRNNNGVVGISTKKANESDWLFTPEQIKEGLK